MPSPQRPVWVNPAKSASWSSAGEAPDIAQLLEVSRLLGRAPPFVDAHGYDSEIIAAAVSDTGALEFVEISAKDVGADRHGANGRRIAVSIRVHLVDCAGEHTSAEIESYNPFFGCDVRFLDWIGSTAILITERSIGRLSVASGTSLRRGS